VRITNKILIRRIGVLILVNEIPALYKAIISLFAYIIEKKYVIENKKESPNDLIIASGKDKRQKYKILKIEIWF